MMTKKIVIGVSVLVAFAAMIALADYAKSDNLKFMKANDPAMFDTPPQSVAFARRMADDPDDPPRHNVPSWWHQENSTYHNSYSVTHWAQSNMHKPDSHSHTPDSGDHTAPSTTHYWTSQRHYAGSRWVDGLGTPTTSK